MQQTNGNDMTTCLLASLLVSCYVMNYSLTQYARLQTDVVFLEREIKSRKQKFGVEVYELMEQLELDIGMNTDDKETKIRLAFDQARKDIAVIAAKIECKREEMAVLEEEQRKSALKTSYDIPPASGVVLQNGQVK